MNGQGQLGPLATLSFPDPIFHFHLHKHTHTTTYNIPKIRCILFQKNYINLKTNNSTMYSTFKPHTITLSLNGHGPVQLNRSNCRLEVLWALASGWSGYQASECCLVAVFFQDYDKHSALLRAILKRKWNILLPQTGFIRRQQVQPLKIYRSADLIDADRLSMHSYSWEKQECLTLPHCK